MPTKHAACLGLVAYATLPIFVLYMGWYGVLAWDMLFSFLLYVMVAREVLGVCGPYKLMLFPFLLLVVTPFAMAAPVCHYIVHGDK